MRHPRHARESQRAVRRYHLPAGAVTVGGGPETSATGQFRTLARRHIHRTILEVSSLAWLPDRGSNLWTCEVYGDEKARVQPGEDLLGAASPIPPLPRQRVPAADTPTTESLPGPGCLASASRWF